MFQNPENVHFQRLKSILKQKFGEKMINVMQIKVVAQIRSGHLGFGAQAAEVEAGGGHHLQSL